MVSTRRLIVSRGLSVNFLHQTLLILEPSSSEIVSTSTTAGAVTGATSGTTVGTTAGATTRATTRASSTDGAITGATAGATVGTTTGTTATASSMDGAVNKSSANTLIIGESTWKLIIAIALAGSFLVMK